MMDVVDAEDRVVGRATRGEIHTKCLPHRIVHVFVFDRAGRLAVQKRSAICAYCPLHWSMSAAGHVRAGESYEEAARRELQEELSVDLPLTYVGKELFLDSTNTKTFIGVYRATSDGPFTLDPQEVQEIDFFTREQIQAMIDKGELFHPQFIHVWRASLGL